MHTVEHYTALRISELVLHIKTWENLTNETVKERSQAQIRTSSVIPIAVTADRDQAGSYPEHIVTTREHQKGFWVLVTFSILIWG